MRLTKSQPPRVTEEAKRTGEFSGSPSPRESSDLDASFVEADILLVTRRVSEEEAATDFASLTRRVTIMVPCV